MIRDRFAAAHKPVFWSAFWIALVLCSLSCVPLQAESANAWYKRGEIAEARNDFDTALNDYQQAAAKSPTDLRIRTALYRVRVSATGLHMTNGRKLARAGDNQGALCDFLHAAEIDTGNEDAH